jgi:hypothetical protein
VGDVSLSWKLPDHREYYVARVATSRDLARRACNSAIAAVHGDLATRFEMLAAQSEPQPPVLLTVV